jgi:uncharacterized protein
VQHAGRFVSAMGRLQTLTIGGDALGRLFIACYHVTVPTARLCILLAVFFLTSMISVVTGSTSLLTVPVMISLGMEPHVAVATNMLALTFMSLGGSVPFMRRGAVVRAYLPLSIALTVMGSALGAIVLLEVPMRALRLSIAVSMIAVAMFVLSKDDLGLSTSRISVSRRTVFTGYLVTFLLAVYGGFFSGGYVTILTAGYIAFFGMTFIQSVATTKIINFFSSAVATLIFIYRGAVDVKLGMLLGVAMFCGAVVGGQIALTLNPIWLRRVFVIAVVGLAIKMLLGPHLPR